MRVELGGKDLDAGRVCFRARPDGFEREFVDSSAADGWAGAANFAGKLLDDVHTHLYDVASERLRARTAHVTEYKQLVEGLDAAAAAPFDAPAFFIMPWTQSEANEVAVKEDCKATIRCFPDALQAELAPGTRCGFSGQEATHMAVFARAF